jgi:RNA polymerase sigma-70 factor (ECF subfamily)
MLSHPPPRLVPPPPERTGSSSDAADDQRLADGLRARREWAERAALERYTPQVRRVLVRILGSPAEVDDLGQEVFLRGINRIGELREGVALRSWFTSFAVNVAREALRARARRRWLLFFAPAELPEPDGEAAETNPDAKADASRALRATYEVLGQMRTAARTAFTLRHLDGMELGEVASACGVSLSTIKRRLEAAEETFRARARRHPLLRAWLEEGEL